MSNPESTSTRTLNKLIDQNNKLLNAIFKVNYTLEPCSENLNKINKNVQIIVDRLYLHTHIPERIIKDIPIINVVLEKSSNPAVAGNSQVTNTNDHKKTTKDYMQEGQYYLGYYLTKALYKGPFSEPIAKGAGNIAKSYDPEVFYEGVSNSMAYDGGYNNNYQDAFKDSFMTEDGLLITREDAEFYSRARNSESPFKKAQLEAAAVTPAWDSLYNHTDNLSKGSYITDDGYELPNDFTYEPPNSINHLFSVIDNAVDALSFLGKDLGELGTAASIGTGIYNITNATPEDRLRVTAKESRRLTGELIGGFIGLSMGPIGSAVVGEALGRIFENYDPEVMGEAILNGPVFDTGELISPSLTSSSKTNSYNLQLNMDGLINQLNIQKNDDIDQIANEVAGIVASNLKATMANYAC